ncbi:MAG: ATP-binding protein, partial [Pseudomonadota bacterium]|nr:ATP-binding protein [Pseudomonadota bacterium]
TNTLELREAELRDANRRKDEFLATLAHELRNPLAPVRNAVQLLRLQGLATPESQWSAEVIDRQVQAMSRLIDDLMDVSRINQGKIELREDWFTAEEVLRDAVECSRPLIDECGHQLVLSLPGEQLSLHADRTRLTQAFMNLLNNAAKYMDRGGRIEVKARQVDDALVVTVKDSGIGIAADRLQSVFELFSQVETALSRSRGGLGVGLSLTRRLVEMHGGTVLARSEGPGLGSEFEVRLPLRAASSASLPQPAKETAADSLMASEQLRILIADDNEDACATLASLLELLGHSVRQAHDGQAAVEATADFDPQVVLLDIGMPKLNGYEACVQIRAQAGGTGRTIVACTGWGQADDRRRSHEAGFDQHLVKPVDPTVLFELLAAVVAEETRTPTGP